MRTVHMTPDIARLIAAWRYDPPYDMYDMAGSGDLTELLNGQYVAVADDAGVVVGFCCFGVSAQVPAGHSGSAYENLSQGTVVDVGLGMRPDLTGRGMGPAFLAFVLQVLEVRHQGAAARLTVAAFNGRAIRLYGRFGFRPTAEFLRGDVPFIVMVRTL